jgi:crotonobetainyl-CoA:carnitine CoA-transferase CaiB-like acyl-CoA transferase
VNDRLPALDGLRVLEASEGVAGAYAGKLLRDQGADVVKLERSEGGDPLRRWSAATPDTPTAQTGALFAFLNGGKASMTGTGATRADELMAWADVILGDGATVALTEGRRRPDTSVVAIESLGIEGPLAGAPATEFTLQAWCGLMSGCGTVATPPLQMGIAHGRWAAGTDSSPARCRSCRAAATGLRSSVAGTVGSVSACSPRSSGPTSRR